MLLECKLNSSILILDQLCLWLRVNIVKNLDMLIFPCEYLRLSLLIGIYSGIKPGVSLWVIENCGLACYVVPVCTMRMSTNCIQLTMDRDRFQRGVVMDPSVKNRRWLNEATLATANMRLSTYQIHVRRITENTWS